MRGGTHNLLDNLGGAVEVDNALVDAELVAVPGLGTLTVGGLTGGDAEHLGGDADGALNLELLVLGTGDEVVADYPTEEKEKKNGQIFNIESRHLPGRTKTGCASRNGRPP